MKECKEGKKRKIGELEKDEEIEDLKKREEIRKIEEKKIKERIEEGDRELVILGRSEKNMEKIGLVR